MGPKEDPERGPEARLQATALPPLPLGCLTSLPPAATRVPGGGPAYRVTAATQPPASAVPWRGCAGGAAPGRGPERGCARRRAVPRQVESRLPGRPGPGPARRRRRRLSHCSKGHRRRRLRGLRRRPGEGRARAGGSRGLPSLPRPTRDLGLRTPRIHLWPQVRGSGCGGRGSCLGFRGAAARRWGALPTTPRGDLGVGGSQAVAVPDP